MGGGGGGGGGVGRGKLTCSEEQDGRLRNKAIFTLHFEYIN